MIVATNLYNPHFLYIILKPSCNKCWRLIHIQPEWLCEWMVSSRSSLNDPVDVVLSQGAARIFRDIYFMMRINLDPNFWGNNTVTTYYFFKCLLTFVGFRMNWYIVWRIINWSMIKGHRAFCFRVQPPIFIECCSGERAIRAIINLSPSFFLRDHFKEIKILTLMSQYIYGNIIYLRSQE